MTSSERPSPEPILKKEAPPAVLGGDNSGNALEASNALNHPSRTLEGNSRKSSESVSGVFPEFFRNLFRKVPAVLGVWPKKLPQGPKTQKIQTNEKVRGGRPETNEKKTRIWLKNDKNDKQRTFGAWVFSVWAFSCHMWALHELHNIPNFTKIILKMI